MTAYMTPRGVLSALIDTIESSTTADREIAAHALGFVRDGVITGEGPTTTGRVHFSRALDAQDVAWCKRILTATAVANQPVSRAEAETLLQISEAASERSDGGSFDDLLTKALMHYAASLSGLPVPPRSVALSPETSVESWAPAKAVSSNAEVNEWISAKMQASRAGNRALTKLVATLVGAASLPIATSFSSIVDLTM
jgi:hypothetical protein